MGSGVGGLGVSSGRVGWYQSRAKRYFEVVNGEVHEYAGLRLGGNELVDALAIFESGDVFVSKTTSGKPGFELYVLDRSAGNWTRLLFPSTGEIDDALRLAGQLDDHLILQSKDWKTLRVVGVNG